MGTTLLAGGGGLDAYAERQRESLLSTDGLLTNLAACLVRLSGPLIYAQSSSKVASSCSNSKSKDGKTFSQSSSNHLSDNFVLDETPEDRFMEEEFRGPDETVLSRVWSCYALETQSDCTVLPGWSIPLTQINLTTFFHIFKISQPMLVLNVGEDRMPVRRALYLQLILS
ncbi:unnamed protein product [Protopolystoma xenopodis]|uniref:Uncharacterized protein n=1 Tax=Protopolystoma xenopodis TaxID=117903 RepID=A0A448WUR9_9PLAT|nr:unnamed protein product [Protopolystoma xenopodis]